VALGSDDAGNFSNYQFFKKPQELNTIWLIKNQCWIFDYVQTTQATIHPENKSNKHWKLKQITEINLKIPQNSLSKNRHNKNTCQRLKDTKTGFFFIISDDFVDFKLEL
jgi:hypothetical protein